MLARAASAASRCSRIAANAPSCSRPDRGVLCHDRDDSGRDGGDRDAARAAATIRSALGLVILLSKASRRSRMAASTLAFSLAASSLYRCVGFLG